MPYVAPSDANNIDVDTIADIKRRNGLGLWRERISASPQQRVVLLHWPPETTHDAHYHAVCDEIFVLWEGRAEFEFGDGQIVHADPGAVLFAPANRPHAIKVLGDEPLLMMCLLAPNVPDDEHAG